MKTGAVVAIQDMGAAGLTSSSCEMGSRGEVGIEIDLDLVPQRETGMTAYEMLLSESQERMLLVAEKGREDEVFQVFKQMGTGRGHHRHRHRRTVCCACAIKGQVVAEIPNPRAGRRSAALRSSATPQPLRKAPMQPPAHSSSADLTADLLQLIGSPDLCSKRWIWEQYDYMVRTNTTAGPGQRCRGGAREGDRHVDRDGARRQRPLLLSRSARRRQAQRGRMLPQPGDHRRDSHRRDQQSELRQSGAARDHGATGGSHRRHGRSVRILRDAHHRRQCQPVQRDAGRRHLSDAGAGRHRTDADGQAGPEQFQNEGAHDPAAGRPGRNGRDCDSAARSTRR